MGRAEFDPYGNVIANTIPLDLTDRLFTGQRFDPNTGLYDYRARFYDPLTGSFVQPDSIVPSPMDPRAWNRFSYVYGNPVNYTDSSGHCIDGLTTLGCLAGAALIGGALNVGVNWFNAGSEYTVRRGAADFLIGAGFGAAGFGIGAMIGGTGYLAATSRVMGYGLLNVAEDATAVYVHNAVFGLGEKTQSLNAFFIGLGGGFIGEGFNLARRFHGDVIVHFRYQSYRTRFMRSNEYRKFWHNAAELLHLVNRAVKSKWATTAMTLHINDLEKAFIKQGVKNLQQRDSNAVSTMAYFAAITIGDVEYVQTALNTISRNTP